MITCHVISMHMCASACLFVLCDAHDHLWCAANWYQLESEKSKHTEWSSALQHLVDRMEEVIGYTETVTKSLRLKIEVGKARPGGELTCVFP